METFLIYRYYCLIKGNLKNYIYILIEYTKVLTIFLPEYKKIFQKCCDLD